MALCHLAAQEVLNNSGREGEKKVAAHNRERPRATFEQLLAFGATFCGSSNLEQILPF